MKTWFHKTDISIKELQPELNEFSRQGWEIYKLWKMGDEQYVCYEIIAYKEQDKPLEEREIKP